MREFSRAAGSALRRARLARRLTLHDVMALSAGRFKPSVVGGYERGERTLSVDRFCELAQLYGVLPDRLLAEALDTVYRDERPDLVDLTRLEAAEEPSER
jgi:transcriptional regulator with XRE-family HTH domain